jgi:hypothetical protein
MRVRVAVAPACTGLIPPAIRAVIVECPAARTPFLVGVLVGMLDQAVNPAAPCPAASVLECHSGTPVIVKYRPLAYSSRPILSSL